MAAFFAVCCATILGPRESASASVGSSAETQSASKPVKEIEVHVDGGQRPAATTAELWKTADIVVEGLIQAGTPLDELFTLYDVQLLEIYKSDSRVRRGTTTITVSRMGGVRDTGAYIE